MDTIAPSEMQAAQFRGFGGPEVLEVVTVAQPVPGPGEVQVRVGASGLNQHDMFVRAGTLRLVTGRKFPLGLGLDFAGEVTATGANVDDVDDVALGSRVWGMVSPKKGHRTGADAQYVVVPADRVSAFPAQLSMVEAASLVTPAESALRALRDVAHTQPGERLLVRGAAGGVGTVAVQLAHALGAHVTALASARDAEHVARFGADEVLDYRATRARDVGPFDVIFDTAGRGMLPFRRRLARGGRMVTVNFSGAPAMAAIALSTILGPRRIRAFSGYPERQLLDDVAQFVQAGAIRPFVDAVYPLDRIADAHRALAAPLRPGRLVLTMGD